MGDKISMDSESRTIEALPEDKTFNLSTVLDMLGVSYQQINKIDEDAFKSIKTWRDSDEHSLIFVNKPDDNTWALLLNSRYSVVILEKYWGLERLNELKNLQSAVFLVENPRIVITKIIRLLYPDDEQYFKGISPTAHIDPDAKIASNVFIGDYCRIGKCQIGENSKIYSFTIIKDNITIGENVVIREHCLVGGSGFGFVRNDDGHLERMPHIGTVIIEDDVELFPYVNVDRGAIGETRIKKGTKIDHYAHIGHNCIIGEHCIVTAGTVFCGGSKIGNQSWVGVGSILKEKVSVGDDVTIGLGSVVLKNFDSNKIIAGVPAKILKKGME